MVWRVDRRTRFLHGSARIVEGFDKDVGGFVAVTVRSNTARSLGRLTLNILFPFAQSGRRMITRAVDPGLDQTIAG